VNIAFKERTKNWRKLARICAYMLLLSYHKNFTKKWLCCLRFKIIL